MAKTVVGLFKSATEAQNIKHELINEGFAAENIRVVSTDADSAYSTGDSVYATSNTGYAAGDPSYTTGTATADRSTTSHETGVVASIKNFFHSFSGAEDTDRDYYSSGVEQGGALLAVTVPDERADAVASLLEQHGASDVNEEYSTAAATNAGSVRGTTTATTATTGTAIPIVEEELQIGKRQVQRGGVRVYSHVIQTPVEEDVRLREEHVRIQRNAVNRPASEADFQAFKEGTIELTETGEEAVVAKEARVVEEVTVGKDVSERTEKVRDTLRHTEVEVEDLPAQTAYKSATTTK
jgi:uncharacterized protein (TIGR02271 family)